MPEGSAVRRIPAPQPLAADPPEATLRAPDGATATLAGGAIELRDQEDRVLVRYVDGTVEIAPARGNLRLSAPAGCIELDAATDVIVRGARDVLLEGSRLFEARSGDGAVRHTSRLRLDPRGATLAAPALDARSTRASLAVGEATVVARVLHTSAARLTAQIEELAITAGHVVERSRDRVIEVSEVLETRAGRVRTAVSDLYALVTRRTSLRSSDDTAIDGKRVLLG